MACHISYRDLDFHASTKGVRVKIWSDVPSHLYLRLSENEPQIHTKSGIRRGYAFIEDLRFCFTVYEDFEQYESGDTTEHTWWLDSWPVCTVKWLYVWGEQGGQPCISTSPPLKYHNDGVDPVTPPRVLKTFTSIEPQLIYDGSTYAWVTRDVIDEVDEGATAVLLYLRKVSPAGLTSFGSRPTGQPNWPYLQFYSGVHYWHIVKLDDIKRFEVFQYSGTVGQWYLMGYFNKNVVMFNDYLDRTPYANGWSTIDCSDVVPTSALAAVIIVGSYAHPTYVCRVRAVGSTDSVDISGVYNHGIVKLTNAQFQFYKNYTANQHRYIIAVIGYITAGGEFYTNGVPVTTATFNSWVRKGISSTFTRPTLHLFEFFDPNRYDIHGIRKGGTTWTWIQSAHNHQFPFVHPLWDKSIDIYHTGAPQELFLKGSLD